MDSLYTVLIKFIPLLILILLGVLIRKARLLKPDTIQGFKTVIINFSLPALLFSTFTTTVFEARYILIILAVFIVCAVMFLLGRGVSKKLYPGNAYYPALFSGFETGMLGYALFSALFGAENTYRIAIFDVGQVLFVFFVLVTYLQRQNGAGLAAGQVVLGFVKTPVIVAIVAGIIFSVSGLTAQIQEYQMTGAFETVLNLLGNLAAPLICLVIGYELRLTASNMLKPFISVLLRMALMLAAAFLLNEFLVVRLLQLDRSFSVALYTLFLLPPPFVIPIYIPQNAVKEKNHILNAISIHIIVTLAAFIVLVTLAT